MYTPKRKTVVVKRVEWHVEARNGAITARDLADSLHIAREEMAAMDVDLQYDDAYYVRGTEDGDVVIWINDEEEEQV